MPPSTDVHVTPRPYQSESIAASLEQLREHRGALIVLPTGTGKGTIISLLAKIGCDHDRTILILLHREGLVKQTIRRLRSDVGIRASMEMGKRRADAWADVVVASVQSLSRPERLQRWNPEAFSLIIVDEAHHGIADSYVRIFEYFHSAKKVGFTATPDRRDAKDILDVFEDVAYEMNIKDAILDGWLVPIRPLFVTIKGLDYSSVRKVAGELHRGDLESVVKNADILEKMVSSTLDYVGDRQTIVFCVTRAHAHACVEYFQKAGRTAAAIDEKTPVRQRQAILDDYTDRNFQFLVNVEIFTEGHDSPQTSAIVMMRPTCSTGLCAQMAGRGLRPLPGVVDGLSSAKLRRHAISVSSKPEALIVDFVGNVQKHGLIRSPAILDPYADEETIAKAEQLVRENEQLPLIEALDMAKELVAEARRREHLEKAEHQAVELDPFMASSTGQMMLTLGLRRIDDPWERRPSLAQVEALSKFGVDGTELNFKEAHALLDELIPRAKKNRANVRQMQALIRAGHPREVVLKMSFEAASAALDARPVSDGQAKILRRFGYRPEQLAEMTSAQASEKIEAIKKNGWKRPSQPRV